MKKGCYVLGSGIAAQIDKKIYQKPQKYFTDLEIKKVAAGSGHLLLQTQECLYGVGNNCNFQLGVQNRQFLELTHLQFFDQMNITDFQCGTYHSLVLINSKDMWVMGGNYSNQCGIRIREVEAPTLIDEVILKGEEVIELNKIEKKQIACGCYHTAFVTNENDLFITGTLITGREQYHWKHVLGNVAEIACGNDFIMALTLNGELYGMGNNDVSQLGSYENSEANSMVKIQGLPSITAISCGHYHTIAMTKQGICFGIGWNKMYNFGIGNRENYKYPVILTGLPRVISFSCGNSFTIFSTYEGVFLSGILGLETEKNTFKFPTLLKTDYSVNLVKCKQDYGVLFFDEDFERRCSELESQNFCKNLYKNKNYLDLIFIIERKGIDEIDSQLYNFHF